MQAAKKKRDPLIRTRLRRIVLAPTSALIVLWLIISGYLAYGAVVHYGYVQANERLLLPSALALVSVMDERSVSSAYVDSPEENQEQLVLAREDVEQRMNSILGDFRELAPLSPEPVQERIAALDEQFDEIDEFRARVDSGQVGHAEIEEYYGALIMAGADLFDEQSRVIPASEVVGPAISATYVFRIVDLLAQADAALTHGFATDEFSMDAQHVFVQRIGAYRGMLEATDDYLGPEQGDMLVSLRESEEYAELSELIDRIAGREVEMETDPFTGGLVEDLSMPVSEEEWQAVYLPVKDSLTEIGASQAMLAAQLQAEVANQAILTAVLGSLGVAAVTALALLFAARSSRHLVERLHRLRDQTQELADRRLPELVRRLKDNEAVDVEAEILSLSDSDDEIGQVSRSFNAAQRTAVEAAVQQAQLRQGINRVFLNIAHRSQTLVHRQLRLLDKLEREQEDPDQLTDLFKLDHLATRARRNAENLLILGGQSPGRTWHQPLPLIDVLRGAISESGDYSRVKRQRIAPVSVQGGAVADVIHLVAELVDNATSFSPPHTKVHLRGDRVPNGVTIEIEDRGLGMKEDELAAANAMLANPPEFDVMRLNEKTRLGLFVVSHLARRHSIKVQLRTSPYGGVLAIVLLPTSLISDAASSPAGEEGDLDAEETASRPHPVRAARPFPAAEDSAPPSGPVPALPPRDDRDVLAPSTDSEPPAPPVAGLPRRIPGVSAFTPPGDGNGNGNGNNGASGGAVHASAEQSPPDTARQPRPSRDGRPPLPRRVPQVNLAPQLCDDLANGADPSDQARPPVDDPERPSRLRQTLSAFQQGTRRGREDGRKRLNDTKKDSQ
ncbi:nitrate- and nitrite sensing domain-containing protein [Thermobifida halotolerans]|uniref:histidine kinase n=1 Tax=Thermobifida halotolerans TaxID=483545 RepID=A0A399FUT8_9ACTN|nr:nitrate- and nitrite sensing domain-containing protein [Thermobifida halotolerans]UOE18166.1 nitrate- and nitrite sensing domain-containing protein [Thermobifida halotolerans]